MKGKPQSVKFTFQVIENRRLWDVLEVIQLERGTGWCGRQKAHVKVSERTRRREGERERKRLETTSVHLSSRQREGRRSPATPRAPMVSREQAHRRLRDSEKGEIAYRGDQGGRGDRRRAYFGPRAMLRAADRCANTAGESLFSVLWPTHAETRPETLFLGLDYVSMLPRDFFFFQQIFSSRRSREEVSTRRGMNFKELRGIMSRGDNERNNTVYRSILMEQKRKTWKNEMRGYNKMTKQQDVYSKKIFNQY